MGRKVWTMLRGPVKQEPSTPLEPEGKAAWFCVRTQIKHEHLAARHLQQIEGVEVFNPRVRFARKTRFGVLWMTEGMFPCYVFARFNLQSTLARVHYAPGVVGVVHFGSRWPTVPEPVITELRTLLGPDEVHLVKEVAPGDSVQIVDGAFQGLEAVVTQVMTGRQRVMVLMDFLGRQTAVEVDARAVIKSNGRG